MSNHEIDNTMGDTRKNTREEVTVLNCCKNLCQAITLPHKKRTNQLPHLMSDVKLSSETSSLESQVVGFPLVLNQQTLPIA